MREQVVIERGDTANGVGLPRPLAPNNGKLRPVPWTNELEGWGLIHEPRARECQIGSLCLVCGEEVEDGFIFVDRKHHYIAPVRASAVDLTDCAADHGPLHSRCAKMTVAHCQHVRNDLLLGETFMIPYCRQGT